MRQTANRYKVITQMGNQGSASEGLRRAVELAWASTVGEVREAHIWLANGDRPHDRPKDQPPIPPGLHWDLWLGPAPYRPYHPDYVPGSWRSWRDFGNGGAGDMGCHTANMAFRALRLDLLWNPDPTVKPVKPALIRIQADMSENHQESYPRRLVARFEFPARGQLPPFRLTWYTGGSKPPREVLLGHLMTAWGCLVSGTKGAVFSSCPWNTRYELLPAAQFQNFKGPEPILPRPGSHHAEWVRACKGGPRTFSSFDIGGPLTEMVLLAHVAGLAGRPIEYDPLTGTITNYAEGNALLHRQYRTGWSL
jgi:hypothetical protein